jgi:hypothetical protein
MEYAAGKTACLFRRVLVAAAMLALSAGAANAQGQGSIFGKATDATGGVLPGVTVTVTGTGLQQPLVGTTKETGAYQFPTVPIGTYSVTFELNGFKKAVRANVIITTGFDAQIDQKMEIGQRTQEMTVTAAAPVVDTKKTNTGGVFTKDILENIPTARDPWQIINMTPGVQAGLNVGGSASGQQVGLSAFGTSANVQWNLEGGSITDLSSNSSPSYFNFDSFEQIQVVTGGGDVSIQSSGLSINLVTKSGSNVFKGSAVTTFENQSMQSENVTPALFAAGSSGFLSGNPLNKITNNSVEYGGPIMRNRLWFWGAADRQDINAGILNFFDPTKGTLCQNLQLAQASGNLAGAISFGQLKQVENCLTNDRTLIKDLEWKFNYQLDASNKFQYLFTSDNKYRNHRNASASTAPVDTNQQTSDAPWKLPLPTHSITHTLILTDKLVFNNQFTYVGGGFFLDYQDVPPQGTCLQSRYLGSALASDYQTGTRANPACLWNVQSQNLRTTGYNQGSLQNTYQTVRKSWEAKTDGTYFLTNLLGGDHSLKFGLGWRKNPIETFSHYSGGAKAGLQCVGNAQANCPAAVAGVYTSPTVPVGSAVGLVPRTATLYRDDLLNNTWHTYNGYLQDSYSHGRIRVNGGIRYDWQTSKYLGGCVPNNPIIPNLIPAQCETATNIDPITGKAIQAFGNWGPRLSTTYDLSGDGKTSLHASFSYFYDTKITLANALGGLASTTTLTYGTNLSSGACNAKASSCWNDANHDGIVQANELIGTPTASSAQFNPATGVFTPVGNIVDPSAQIGRTREFITGVQHELIPNLAVGVDYIYRKFDRGTATYVVGTQPGAAGFPLSSIYTGPITYTDPVTGMSAPYFQVCATCVRPTGANIAVTRIGFATYSGVTATVNKRFADRWQLNGSLTVQKNPIFSPTGSFSDPTGIQFQNGVSVIARYLVKVNGSYALPWGITASADLNVNDGATRRETITGPGNVFGGVGQTTLTDNNLEFQPRNAVRFGPTKLLDVGVQKVFSFNGGKDRLKLMLDAFNIFNINTITGFSSNNLGDANFSSPNGIVPPRVYRIGLSIAF